MGIRMAKKKIYPIGVSGSGILFFDADPQPGMDGRTHDGYVAWFSADQVEPISLIAFLMRPHAMQPYDDSPLASLLLADNGGPDFAKIALEGDKATIAKYTAKRPGPIELPDEVKPAMIESLKKVGIL